MGSLWGLYRLIAGLYEVPAESHYETFQITKQCKAVSYLMSEVSLGSCYIPLMAFLNLMEDEGALMFPFWAISAVSVLRMMVGQNSRW